ncbi:MAG: sodium:calcium antiporter [Nanoarchaeota archaeon]|nr:sodium:calcium antiporter [Nanoarchaeota archaeon]
MLLNNLFYFMIFSFLLILSGIFLIKSLEKIAKFFRISQFTAAFILMAFATSIPELLVGISSAIQGNPALSLGNIIGANIIDLTLITGIFVLLSKGKELKTKKIGVGVYPMFGSIFLIILLYIIGNSLSRIDGAILLIFFGANSYRMFRKKEKYNKELSKQTTKDNKIFYAFLFISSLIVLFFSAQYLVKYSSIIAEELGVPQLIIGLFLISFATTLPELVFGIGAVLSGRSEMALGDQTGAVFTHTTLIIGLVSVIHPISAALLPLVISVISMSLAASLFVIFIRSGRKLDFLEGLSLILFYAFFVAIQFFI